MPERENEGTDIGPAGSPFHPRDATDAIHPEYEDTPADQPRPYAGPKSIVVGIDGSAESGAALHWAVRHAHDIGANVEAVAVWQQPPQFGLNALPPPPSQAFEAEARQWLADALPEPDSIDSLEVHTHIEQGDPVTVLLDYALRADLLVLGNKGRGALASALLGSVAQRCAHHARCPVVLVPTPPTPDITPPR
jgi:nucleotide-binding universal stress UspA family protein